MNKLINRTKTTLHNTPRSEPAPRCQRWIAEGELKCSGPGCGKPIPAGYYGSSKTIYLCCHNCQYKYNLLHREKVRCVFCKKMYVPTNTGINARFCSKEHFAEYRRAETDRRAGRFAKVFAEFMEAYGIRYYSPGTQSTTRNNLIPFLEFLNNLKIRSLNSVTPRTITAYQASLQKRGLKAVDRQMGTVKLFFDWLTYEDRRKASPVITKLHLQRRGKRLPRPFTPEELKLIWQVLEANGDLNLMVAVSLGEHSALRIGEACNVRISDLNLDQGQEVLIRLPVKTQQEHVVPISDRTKQLVIQLLAQRGQYDHDFLLTTPNGIPMSKFNLRKRLNRLLCGPGKLAKFSFHRLRHRAATAMHRAGADTTTVMRTFGWRNPSVAQNYIEVLPAEIRESYDRATSGTAERERPESKLVSMEEFFASETNAAPNPEHTNK
jgi:integrase/recombinase XerD